jgi:hypothetical protein
VALFLHAPFVPNYLLDWVKLLFSEKVELADMDGEVVIPIELDIAQGEEAPPAAPKPEKPTEPASDEMVEPSPSATAKAPDKDKKEKEPKDAGVDAAPPKDAGEDAERPDAEVADAGAEDAGSADGGEADASADAGAVASVDAGADGGAVAAADSDAGADAGAVAAADMDAGADAATVATSVPADAGSPVGTPTLGDPLSVSGGAAQFASKHPNVQVLINGERIRDHALGAMFGRILTSIPQWQSFFEGTDIDPIRDVDQLLITGPQLRDSSKVVVTMDYNVPQAKMRKAVDAIVQRSKPNGGPIEGAPVPAWKAQADRSERIFAMVPGKPLLYVLPTDSKDQLPKLKGAKGFGATPAAGIFLSMVTPGRAFKGLPVEVPQTLEWLRLTVTPTSDGGADVLLETQDKDASLAGKDAAVLTGLVEMLRARAVIPFIGQIDILDPTAFVAEGRLIRARTHVKPNQLHNILRAVSFLMPRPPQAAQQK